MKISPNHVFHFIRGALRGAYGREQFEGLKLLIVGIEEIGQQILTMFCAGDMEVFFLDHSLVHYDHAHMVCPKVIPYTGQPIDIVVNLTERFVTFKEKSFSLDAIGENSYDQGIQAFYL